MSDHSGGRARYPLRAVIRRTGLSADVLRAWERRYGAVQPQRSEGGQRLYSDDDLDRLVLLQRATAAGHSISEIARLERVPLEALIETSKRPRLGGGNSEHALRDATQAIERFDSVALDSALKRVALAAGTEAFVDDVMPRFLHGVGERWHRGSLTPAHEHLASDAVRRVLAWIIDAYDVPPTAPRILIATPTAELHELGAMLVAAAAAGEGWRVLYLGANLPASDIVAAAKKVGARAVALSVVYADGEATIRDLRETASGLPPETLMIIGGSAAVRIERAINDARIRVLGDLDRLRETLRANSDVADDGTGSRAVASS